MTTKAGTLSIGPKQAAGAFHAVRFANDNGRAMNLLITINFSDLGIDPDDAGQFFKEIWARFTRWYAYQRDRKGRPFGKFSAYAVHEHPAGGRRHVHWVMHAPEGAKEEIERVVRDRICKLVGVDCVGGAVDVREAYSPGQLAKYTLKGIDPLYASHFHMTAEDQGFISGRRLTVSRNIGHAARRAAGWVRRRRPRET